MLSKPELKDFLLDYPNMRIGRFSLNAGEKIPLHIHAHQFGLVYLLEGKCQVTRYIIKSVNNDLFMLNLESTQDLIAHSYCTVTPKINAHEIYAYENSIFLDIFAPGTNQERISDYLKLLKTGDHGGRLTALKVPITEIDLPISLRNDIEDSFTIS